MTNSRNNIEIDNSENSLEKKVSAHSKTFGLTRKITKRIADFYQKHPKKIIAGSILTGAMAVTGMSQDMRIVNKPYASVVEDFLENQKVQNGEKWVQPEHVEYSKLWISKERNMPYESAPLMKIKENNGKTHVTDMWWIDDNGNIISLKDIFNENKGLLIEGFDQANIKDANFMKEFWYAIGTTMVNERKFASWWVQWSRRFPDILHEKVLEEEVSRSSARVKRNTLEGYSNEEKKIIVWKLAHFKMKMASRERQLIGGSGDEKCNQEFCPIYEIAGYDSPEKFEADFLSREKDFLFQDKIKTNHEIGVALGIIILAHTRDKSFMSNDLRKGVNSRLIKNGVFSESKIRSSDTEDKNQLYEMQNNLIHFMPERVNTVMNDYFIDVKEHKKQPYDRSAILYPTNIDKVINDSKLQMFVNFMAMNTGKFDKIITVDWYTGKKTQETLEYFGQVLPKYNKEKKLDKKLQQTIENTAITWGKNLSGVSVRMRENMKNNVEFFPEDMQFLEKSMSVNADSMWFTYRTIRHFLNIHNKKDEIIELDEAFMDYVLRNKWKDQEKIFEIFASYVNKDILIEKFGTKTADNNALYFIKYLSQWLILLNNYAVQTGFSPNLYSAGGITSNEANTMGRGTTNVYTECLNSEKCG